MNGKIKDAFDGVRAEEALKTNTKAYLAKKARAARGPARFVKRAAAFACVALVILSGAGLYFSPVSAISVDVNPSVELGVNRFDRVVAVKAYNDEGTALASASALMYRDYADALEALMSGEEMRPYLQNDALVSIAVVGSSEEKSDEMMTRISACGFSGLSNVECRRGNREEAEAAREAGLSLGKYRAFLEWRALDPEVEAEDAQGLSMRQIRDEIEALGGEGARHGNGNRRHGE